MGYVLIVEDSPEQARIIAALLEAEDHDTEVVGNGADALAAIAKRQPEIVLTDLVMPRLDGLQLVEAVTKQYVSVPVILMTAYGSGEVAMKALQAGAASYVPKRRLYEDLVETVEKVLELSRARRQRDRVLEWMVDCESRFELNNDDSLIPPLVGYAQEMIRDCRDDFDESQLLQVGVALEEALLNAVHHGNLEVSSELRETSLGAYRKQIQQRREEAAYRDRRVRLTVRASRSELVIAVEDDGDGFDTSTVPDPTEGENLLREHGRGLCLIRAFMDKVTHNDTGNRITMTKRLGATA
jgi:CheY-like chemotaxis protein/anti-sigma regulatory factor (Ser/Thr protein kinase)